MGRVNTGPHIGALKDLLGEEYAPSLVLPVNAGRTALRLALATFSARQPKKKRVLLPAYLCPSVVDTVRVLGLEPIPVPVGTDLNLNPDRLVFDERVLAVVAAHMYGCPARIDEIEHRCQEAGVYLIDDAAQVVGVRYGGRLLGTFGQAGLLSFAQSKTLVTGIRGSGGVLLVNDPEFGADLRSAHARLQEPSGRLGSYLMFLADYQLASSMGWLSYYVCRFAHRLFPAKGDPYVPARLANLDAAIALAQLARLPVILAAKSRIADWYLDALSSLPGIDLPQLAPGQFVARCMAAFTDRELAGRVRKVFAAKGIATRDGYHVWGDTLARPAQIPTLLELPCRANMSRDDVRQITDAIRAALVMQVV